LLIPTFCSIKGIKRFNRDYWKEAQIGRRPPNKYTIGGRRFGNKAGNRDDEGIKGKLQRRKTGHAGNLRGPDNDAKRNSKKNRMQRAGTKPLKMSTANARHSDINDIELGEVQAERPAAFNPEFKESGSQTNDFVGEYGLGATFGGDIIAGVMSAPEINSLSSTPPRPLNVNDLNQESSQSSIDFVPLDVNHSESLGDDLLKMSSEEEPIDKATSSNDDSDALPSLPPGTPSMSDNGERDLMADIDALMLGGEATNSSDDVAPAVVDDESSSLPVPPGMAVQSLSDDDDDEALPVTVLDGSGDWGHIDSGGSSDVGDAMPVVPDALESSSLDVADFEVENVDVPAAADSSGELEDLGDIGSLPEVPMFNNDSDDSSIEEYSL